MAGTGKGDELILHSGNISGVAKLTKRATQSTANEVENYSIPALCVQLNY